MTRSTVTTASFYLVLAASLSLAIAQESPSGQKQPAPHSPPSSGHSAQSQSGHQRPTQHQGPAGGHQPGRDALTKACAEDVQHLCSSVPHGQPKAVAQCLGKNRQSLSTQCSQALDRAKRVAAFRRSCGQDVKNVCSDTQPGEKRVLTCLQQNQDSLSDACKTLVSKASDKTASKDLVAVTEDALNEVLADEDVAVDLDTTAEPAAPENQD
jgi:hypothetical protein